MNNTDITTAALRPINAAIAANNFKHAAILIAALAEPEQGGDEPGYRRAVRAAETALQQGRSLRQAWAAVLWARRRAAMAVRAHRRLEIYYLQDQRSAARARKRGFVDFEDYVWDVIEADLAERQLYQKHIDGELDVSVENVLPDPRADQLLCEEAWNHELCGGHYKGVPTEDDDE